MQIEIQKSGFKCICCGITKFLETKHNERQLFTFFRAPTDCLQYLTGPSNSFRSYNFGNTMIRNLQYDVCIRPEEGMCQFQVRESSTQTDSFRLSNMNGPAFTTAATGISEVSTFFPRGY